MPLYPTEGVLWDENQIPSVNYTGEPCVNYTGGPGVAPVGDSQAGADAAKQV